ncbi:MAG: hypothetical protein NT178_17720 [Proteobacteria bacterium]|nr:hypothetical protein [Pseudomonadota bacterium]
MKAKARFIAIGVALLVIGMAVGYYFAVAVKTPRNFDWKALSLDQPGKGYGYSSEALFGSDIRLPEIRKLSGKCKFLSASPKSRNEELNLGYVVSVDVEKLDLQRVPQKYKVEKKEKYKSGEWTVPPIDEVVYSVTFAFTLKDKDGFILLELKSPSHSIYSGKVNVFQSVVEKPILPAIAERVANITLSMMVEKCETCN